KGRGNAERGAVGVLQDERRAGGVPGGVAARFKGGADAAGREAGRVRLALDQLLAAELGDGLSPIGRGKKRVMLLGGQAGHRLEPVRVMGRSSLERPLLDRGGDHVGDRWVERSTLL